MQGIRPGDVYDPWDIYKDLDEGNKKWREDHAKKIVESKVTEVKREETTHAELHGPQDDAKKREETDDGTGRIVENVPPKRKPGRPRKQPVDRIDDIIRKIEGK